jgi:hypothetical protein
MNRTTTITVTLFGPADAVLSIAGPADDDAVSRARTLLTGLVLCGARRVIADLSAAIDVPDGLLQVLGRNCGELTERGGWLLVEGGDDLDAERALQDAFAAYREALAAA